MSMNSLRVSTRIQLLVGLMLVGLIALCLTALFQLKTSMMDDRKEKTKNLVEISLGVITHHHKLFSEGKLSEEDAKIAARNSLRPLRYGKNDYYFGFDTSGVYFLHGGNQAVEGQNKLDLKDTNGKFLVKDLIAAAQAGGDFVEYWFPRAGQQTSEPKISYAALFAPWNWVIGTGIYFDDVEREYKQAATLLGGISFGLVVLLSLIGWRVGGSVLRQLGGEPNIAADIMRRVASGDLTASVGNAPKDSLLGALDDMVKSLRDLMSQLTANANQLVSNAEQIKHASAEVSKAADHQTDATSSMAAAIEQLTVSSNHISDSARDTEADSRNAMALSAEGAQRVGQATMAIQKIATTVTDASGRIRALEERAKQVSSIANVIKDIAGQTNLLALNAAIEAARAGEQGRGFAVVADEVRKLAERTSSATTEIEQMILGIQSDTVGAVEAMSAALPEVEHGVQLANHASESLRGIEEGAGRTLDRIGEVASATREQSVASTSIAQRVEEIAQMVEETTITIRGTADAADHLEHIAQELKQQVGRFKL
jgi:methyl-accepting chemotaxis protein